MDEVPCGATLLEAVTAGGSPDEKFGAGEVAERVEVGPEEYGIQKKRDWCFSGGTLKQKMPPYKNWQVACAYTNLVGEDRTGILIFVLD